MIPIWDAYSDLATGPVKDPLGLPRNVRDFPLAFVDSLVFVFLNDF